MLLGLKRAAWHSEGSQHHLAGAALGAGSGEVGVLWKGFELQVGTRAQHGLSAGVNVALLPSGRLLCPRGDCLGLVGANRHVTPLRGWGGSF